MIKNPYAGKFIVFEGLDGSGQTTQAHALADALKAQEKEVLVTKEPTQNSEAGKRIRNVLDKKEVLGGQKLQQLFAKDRKMHLENKIIPALEQGTWVISDRYAFSSFAFGTSAGAEFNWLIDLNSEFLLPDATFLLKVAPKICMTRIASRGEKRTLFEQEQKLQRVWEVYKTIPEKFPNIHLINGEQSIAEVKKTIWQIISEQLD